MTDLLVVHEPRGLEHLLCLGPPAELQEAFRQVVQGLLLADNANRNV